MYQYIGSHPSPRRPLQCCKARGGFDTSPGPYILNEMGAYIYMHTAPKYTPVYLSLVLLACFIHSQQVFGNLMNWLTLFF